MENDLLSKLSNLGMLAFFDLSKKMVVAHFFNKDEGKKDIMAFLKKDLSWDVREVIEENSVLLSTKEIVEFTHNPLGCYSNGGDFDIFIRTYINNLAKSDNGVDQAVLDILEKGYQKLN